MEKWNLFINPAPAGGYITGKITNITNIIKNMKNTKKYPCYRSKSGNSYLIIKELENGLLHIFFPFVEIRGVNGTIPKESCSQDTYLGDVLTEEDNKTPEFNSLIAITGGN